MHTLKHIVSGKCVINVVTVTFKHGDISKLAGMLVASCTFIHKCCSLVAFAENRNYRPTVSYPGTKLSRMATFTYMYLYSETSVLVQ